MRIANSIKSWAKKVKQDSVMLWFAQKHPQTPVMAKIVCVLAVAYALSPIDLIPDFIPVIGYLDDALLVPALIWIAVKLIPKNVLEECRAQASEWIEKDNKKPRSYIGAIAIIIIWIALFGWGIWFWTR
nr:YkvA family protein [Herbaspirillum sp. CF444]